MDDQEKKLKMMRFWLFGTFLIIFVAAVIYIGGVWKTGLAVLGLLNFWLAFIIAAVLFIVFYYIYKGYLGKNK